MLNDMTMLENIIENIVKLASLTGLASLALYDPKQFFADFTLRKIGKKRMDLSMKLAKSRMESDLPESLQGVFMLIYAAALNELGESLDEGQQEYYSEVLQSAKKRASVYPVGDESGEG